jgi:putative ABC transport system permease protein
VTRIGLIWSSLFRRPVRTWLTLFSVIVAFLLFALLRSIANAFTVGAEIAGVDRIMVGSKYSIIDPMPVRYMQEIEQVDGVEAVTHWSWFGGFYQDPNNFFPKHPIEPRKYFDMYPELIIDPEQLDAFANTRTGAVIARKTADKYGFEIGDKIPIEADIWPLKDGSRLWEFDLVGIFERDPDEPQPSSMYFHYDYFDEARQFGEGSVGRFIVRVTNPDAAADVALAIDELFENSSAPTRTATEAEWAKSFANQVGDIGLIMTGILSAVFFTIVLLTGNTMAQALRERVPELAVMKTLGFTDIGVSTLVLAEAVVLCLVGGLVGIGLAAILSPGIKEGLADILPGYSFTWPIVANGALLAAVLGLVIGAIPALTARRLKIVDALRGH